MRFGIVESPFAPQDKTLPKEHPLYIQEVGENLTYARIASHILLTKEHTAPFASHLLYTQPNILDDTIPEERQLGIDAGLELAKRADISFVFYDLGVSGGMVYGIKNALQQGREVKLVSFEDYGYQNELQEKLGNRRHFQLSECVEVLTKNGIDCEPFLTQSQKAQLELEKDLTVGIKNQVENTHEKQATLKR